MRWVRSHGRFGSCLALFALALQLALSFGHFHSDARINRAGPWLAATSFVNSPVSGEIPEQPSKHTKFADFCAICAVVHMTSSSLIATPPSHSLPDFVSHELMPWSFGTLLIASRRSSSQPRAPPAA
jgi:hypothetical protein